MANKIIEEDILTITSGDMPWEKFAGKVVLITGANGFLPAYMAYTLLYLNKKTPGFNVTVLAMVRNIERARQKFKDHLDDKHLIIIEQNVSDEPRIGADQKIDIIIHAASQASPKYYGIDPVGTLSANVLGTMNLMALARQKNTAEFFYFSSAEVYGQANGEDNLVKEDHYGYLDPTMVRSCYAESKRMGENICVSYAHQYGINAKIVRPFHTFGPGMDLNDGRVFVDFVADVVNGNNIVMKSDGSAKRAYCYVTDAITAYFKVLLNGDNGNAYNVGNPHNELSVLELANILVTLFDDKQLKVVRSEEVNTNKYLASKVSRIIPDIEKIKKLNWEPQVTVQDGFYRTIKSYSDN